MDKNHQPIHLKDRALRQQLAEMGVTVPTFRNGRNGTFICVQTGVRLRQSQLNGYRAQMVNNRPGRKKERFRQNVVARVGRGQYYGFAVWDCPECNEINTERWAGPTDCARCHAPVNVARNPAIVMDRRDSPVLRVVEATNNGGVFLTALCPHCGETQRWYQLPEGPDTCRCGHSFLVRERPTKSRQPAEDRGLSLYGLPSAAE